jgi:hypothetical protein
MELVAPSERVEAWARAFMAQRFAVLEDPLDPAGQEALRAEAATARAAAWVCARGPKDAPPEQRNHRADLGPSARALVGGAPLLALLEAVTGLRVAPAYEATCFTFYGPGDHLAPHRDRPESCALTFLLYLEAAHVAALGPGPGLGLEVRAGEAGPRVAAIPTRTGRGVILLGSEVWHGRPRLWPGESVAMLSACFRRTNG